MARLEPLSSSTPALRQAAAKKHLCFLRLELSQRDYGTLRTGWQRLPAPTGRDCG